MSQNYINHIAMVLDASGSMAHHARNVITVADQQIKHLAQRSKELDQETRVTVYTFDYGTRIDCIFYDKDVLRMPSLEGKYRPGGGTALIDATMKALEDLAKTPELYGDHAFLAYVLTDGQENDSRKYNYAQLNQHITKLKENWTVAAFVPDQSCKFEAKKFGFPADNIAVWDATSDKGVVEVGETMKRATDMYMTTRAAGVRGYKNLFSPTVNAVSSSSVVGLAKLGFQQYRMLDVDAEAPIAPFVEKATKRAYKLGEAYYQLTKPEKIQPSKAIAILDRKTKDVYTGANARSLLSLPDYEVRVSPTQHPDYDLFVQSTSVNRKLVAGTKLMLVSA